MQEHDKQLKELNSQHDKQLKELNTQHDKKINELNSEITKLKYNVDELSKRMDKI